MPKLTIAKLTSSQTKLFPETVDMPVVDIPLVEEGYAFADEPHHFQLALRCDTIQGKAVSVQVTSDIPTEVFHIGYVPVNHPMVFDTDTVGFAKREPGLYPDPLYARPSAPTVERAGQIWREKDTKATINLASANTAGVWITCNPNGEMLSAGDHTITVQVLYLEGANVEEMATLTYTLHVLPHALAENTVYYTNWFHCDCLCDTYDIPVWSERFWDILPAWLGQAAKNGMTTLLIPAFTPPLDTPIDHERMNVQLVDITVTEDGYHFDFARLERFIKLALDCGFRYLEHAHLFSQWGAAHAPNIYDVNGKRIFGWDTDAGGETYRGFLTAYLTELMAFSDKLGIQDRWVFHVSDEPAAEHLENYRRGRALVEPLVQGCPIADAVFHAEYAANGTVQVPVAEVTLADAFAETCGCDKTKAPAENPIDLWLYYTGGSSRCTNRMLPHTPARTRVLGTILYRYGAVGFLHWGYNFYYDRMSVGLFDPLSDPCGYKQMPGSPYLVYPGLNGKPVPSIREMLMGEAMCDLRMLWKAEELLGKEAVLALMNEVFGETVTCRTIPEGDTLLELHKRIYEAILAK